MGKIELRDKLISLGFMFTGESNTRKKYTYKNMTVEIIYGKGKYGVSIIINRYTDQRMYQSSNGTYINVWAYEMAEKYIAQNPY